MDFCFIMRSISGSLCIGYTFYLIHRVIEHIGKSYEAKS